MSDEAELLNDPTVVTTRDLIRFDTQNWGGGKSNGEQEAAEYLAARLEAIDAKPTVYESAPRRTSLVARIPGKNPEKPAIVVHGHTDVVPAAAEDWRYDPFGAEIHDGMVWGRGAVDMKNMDAMIITALEELHANGEQPEREVIVAFFADEEDAGRLGAQSVVDDHPEYFAGATEAISEVGGFSIEVAGKRAYLMQTGEKGMIWLRLVAKRPAGHGSRYIPRQDNAISSLAAAIVRLVEHEWPVVLGETSTEMIDAIAALVGDRPSETTPDALVQQSGFAASWLTAALRPTANPTMLSAGYKHNVIPATASVAIDVRPLPGREDAALSEIRRLVGPDIEVEIDWQVNGTESPVATDLVSQAHASLKAHDPDAVIVPYLLPAGTDNKALGRLGIRGYGFAPLQLPSDLDFPGMFHGVDERVPMKSLVFGRKVLLDFLRNY